MTAITVLDTATLTGDARLGALEDRGFVTAPAAPPADSVFHHQ